jgi:SNF family Na+-dependent transporter
MDLIDKKKRIVFYFKELAIFAVPIFSFILISYIYVMKNVHPGIKIASFIALPYSLYLAYIYVFSSETFCKTVKDYFNFNAEYIQSKNLLNNIKKDNLAEGLDSFKGGTPNNRIRKYIRKSK